MIEILIIFFAVVVAGLLAFMIYRAMRTYDAGAHATFITTKNGDFYGALRAPMTIWDPTIKVLRDRRAPEITIMTIDAAGNYYEKSLVNRRTGEISLRVHTCAPRPFVTRTADKRSLIIKAKVSFQLDIDRIQIPTQMEAFGATLGSRVQNLFDNAIGALEDQDVFAKQREIEAGVLAELLAIENPAPESGQVAAMPMGIKIYEAMFSYEPHAKELNKDPSNGPMAYDNEHLDDLVDMLEKANPQTVEVLMRMLELQTRQNIVQMLCKSGGLVAFTASELGLSERTVDRAANGANIMKPAAQPAASLMNGATIVETPNAPAAPPLDAAAAYYGLGPPKGAQPPKGN
ncbi:MAG TPA: hypothetical protein VFV70_01845 [Hyphomonadaceae bacterium]|nr:hypothetical protein [Hyphomonadaceae bacterium]